MTLDEFQKWCMETKKWPVHREVDYPVLALAGEAGELANKLKKIWRSEVRQFSHTAVGLTVENVEQLADETMDCMYYCVAVLDDLGITPQEAFEKYLKPKLDSRHRK